MSWWLLYLATLFFVLWGAVSIFSGRGLVEVTGSSTDVTVELTTPDGQTARSESGNRNVNFPANGETFPATTGITTDGTALTVSVTDRLLRGVLIANFVLFFAAAWAALTSLQALTNSFAAGHTFTRHNAAKLSRLGLAIVAFPVFRVGGAWVFNQVSNSDRIGVVGFARDLNVAENIMWAAAGLFVLALTQAFRHGLQLQEFERATI